MKNDRQQKDLKEMALPHSHSSKRFILPFRFSVFSNGSPQPQPALFIKKHPAGAECFFHDWMTEKLLIMPLSFSQTFSHFFVSK